jgi:hypothetical protein
MLREILLILLALFLLPLAELIPFVLALILYIFIIAVMVVSLIAVFYHNGLTKDVGLIFLGLCFCLLIISSNKK